MNIAQIEQNVCQVLLTSDQPNFIYDLLTAYGKPKASITRLHSGEYNLSKHKTSVVWKSHVYFSATSTQKPGELLKQMKLVDGVKGIWVAIREPNMHMNFPSVIASC